MSKTIWIVNYYTGTPLNASNRRYLELAKYFMDAGYNVITFNSAYRGKGVIEDIPPGKNYIEKTYGRYKFVHIACPHYIGNGFKRMYSILKFALIFFFIRNKLEKPVIILHNIHTPFDFPVFVAAKFMKVKYIAECWDLWPEDFEVWGLVSKYNPFLKIAYWIEKFIYYYADELIFTFKGIYDYLDKKNLTLEKGGKVNLNKVHYINNGIDLSKFDSDKIVYSRDDKELNDPSTIKVVYLGSIQLANQIKTLIDAAVVLKNQPNIKFLIYGDGVDRSMLETYVKDNHISNVFFKERKINFEECAWVVSNSSINILNYGKRFGRMGLSSGKLWLYLAAGKPIICNIHIPYDDIITENNLGIAKDIDSPEEYADIIKSIAFLPKVEYDSICRRVRMCAAKYDYKVLAEEELTIIEKQ